jgi:hypothetical protein
MTRLMISLAATATVVGGIAVLPTPAIAQQSNAEVVVYGSDPCPRSTDDQIVVCTHRPEQERYRIPQNLRPSGTRQQRQAWANKSRELQRVGSTGINSCSAVGPGGSTGCLLQDIKQARQESSETTESSTPPQ